jgi:hypothetical protein
LIGSWLTPPATGAIEIERGGDENITINHGCGGGDCGGGGNRGGGDNGGDGSDGGGIESDGGVGCGRVSIDGGGDRGGEDERDDEDDYGGGKSNGGGIDSDDDDARQEDKRGDIDSFPRAMMHDKRTRGGTSTLFLGPWLGMPNHQ